MKNIFFSSILVAAEIFFSKISFAQNTFPSTGAAGIGTTSPNASSLLDVTSTTKGILVPRMTKTQRDAITSPAQGLLIFQTNSTPGFYYYNGTAWTAVSTKGANTTLSNLSVTAVNVDLLPGLNDAHNFGSSTQRWKDVNLYNLKFADGTTQTTAFTPYTASTGITISGNSITNSLPTQWTTSGSNIYFNSGNVGIGTPSPSSMLQVEGEARIHGLTIGTGSGNVATNTAIGNGALNFNTTGFGNTAIGSAALSDNTTGADNTSTGDSALSANTTGNYNTANGFFALHATTTGETNTANGAYSLSANTLGDANTANGFSALSANTTGFDNTANGWAALNYNTTGFYNTANGAYSLYANTTSYDNTADGYEALFANTTGYGNAANGADALVLNTTGNNNTADGVLAGSNVTTGSNNTFLGYNANCGSLGTLSNSTAIGYLASVTTSNSFVFGNSSVVGWGFGVGPGARAIKVGTSSSNGNGAYLTVGGTWTNTSARNKKEDFQKQDRNSILEKINQLEVTKWKYKGTVDEYHYGPMADDFHRMFEVGDDSSTSDMDKTGVLFLGMQALSEENKSLQSAVYSLQKENAEMINQIAQLQLSTANGEPLMNDGYAKLQTSDFIPQTLLGQNIPNPFDNSTLIPFRIPKDCHDASIMIANTTTSEVISVIPISCNEDHVSVDAGILASGAYSYSLYVNGKMIDTKSMILTR